MRIFKDTFSQNYKCRLPKKLWTQKASKQSKLLVALTCFVKQKLNNVKYSLWWSVKY